MENKGSPGKIGIGKKKWERGGGGAPLTLSVNGFFFVMALKWS